MKARIVNLALVCLLSICVPLAAQPDILSAVPADAYGFAATNSLQGSYDKIMAFAGAMGLPAPADNKLLAIKEHLGEVNLNGPAAIILLDPQKFSGEPIALLFSAEDPEGLLQSHAANAEEGDADVELPAGVVAGPDGYLAIKNGFVVFAPKLEQLTAVLAGQTPFETMPAVKDAFDKDKIVLAGDLQRAAPWMIQMLTSAQAQMSAQMDATPMPQSAMVKDMFSLYLELAQGLLEQTDKLAVELDVTPERAILSKHVLFKADSPAAAFMNAQVGQPIPTYNALPGGPFLMAGGASMVGEELQSLTETILNKLMDLPSFREKVSEEQLQKMIADTMAGNAQLSGYSFTFNLGNPMTGMFNVVARYDVSNAPSYIEIMKKTSSGEAATMWSKAFGVPFEYELVYSSAAETYSGVEVDTIKIQITPPAEGTEANPMIAQQMQQGMAMMYGPDMTFRVAAPTDKQVLFTMGGGAEAMERAINVAQGNGSVLANQPKLKQAAASLPVNRFAEAHLDLSQVMPMIMMMAMAGGAGQPGAMPPGAAAGGVEAPPVSFSCSAGADTFRADMVLPSATVKAFVEALDPMMQQGMQPGGSEPPDEEF